MGVEEAMPSAVNRRGFLRLSLGLLVAMSLGPGAGDGHAAQNRFPEGRCGGGPETAKRILIAYASKYGSTAGVADAMGKELCGRELSADVLQIGNVKNLASYQAVALGSAIYRGRWMPEAVDFLKKNREALRRIPVAYFLVCMTLARPSEKDHAEALSYLDPVLKAVPEIRPVAIGAFAGAVDYGNLSWVTQEVLRSKGTPEGDFRDWDAIRAWARERLASACA